MFSSSVLSCFRRNVVCKSWTSSTGCSERRSSVLIKRHLTQHQVDQSPSQQQREWRLTNYSMESLEVVTLKDHELRRVSSPNDVLIEVKAASINPIDLAVARGYGNRVFSVLRSLKTLTGTERITYDKFPMTLGRDFSGVVVSRGSNVNNVREGDEVMGFTPLSSTKGSHSSHVVTDKDCLVLKPQGLSYEEAASLPYAAVTAISAATISAGIFNQSPGNSEKNVLVLGSTGGVGSLLVQILKAFGVESVTAVCSPNAKEWTEEKIPDVDHIVSYANEYRELMSLNQSFDVVFNCAPMSAGHLIHPKVLQVMKKKGKKELCGSKFVTLTTPVLSNIDSLGLPFGALKSLSELTRSNIEYCLKHGISIRWAFFTPSGQLLKQVSDLASTARLKAIIDQVFPFDATPDAYKHVESGHARGKTIIRMSNK